MKTTKNFLIVLGGPTASGKTSLSIQLAQHFSCPILSADSRQFYREMIVGTAKPSKEELSQVKHYFINSLSIQDNYSVGQYEQEAIQLLNSLFQDNKFAIVVGGTGLYLNTLINGIDPFPSVPSEVRDYYSDRYEKLGIETLQDELKDKDPDYFATVDIHNQHRLIRALSFIKTTGQKFNDFRLKKSVDRAFTAIPIAITMDRAKLYERIEKRVDKMLEDGLINEARSLYPLKTLNALNTVGYKELFNFFDGDWTKEQAIDKIKQHTRNYAKRQITWFKNQGNWKSIDPNDTEELVAYIEKCTKA